MEASKITMFKDLDVSNTDCVLKVCILRLWCLKENNKTGEDWSIEMILQDEMGDRMQAYVRKACIPKHNVWLGKNQSLIVRKPSLGANLSTYRYVDSPHKLCFTSETCLCITDEFKGQLYGLSLATFDDIKAKNIPQNGTIENVYVNNSYGNAVSRLLINDYVYEVIDYKKRLLEISSEVHVEIPKLAKNIIIIGTVKAIVGNKEWYYNGCKRCSRKVSEVLVDGQKVYECKIASCNSQGVIAGPRFRIPIRVQDTTGVVSLTLFDRDARQLFNKAADHFVTTDVEPNDNQSLTIGSTSGLKSTEKDTCTPSSNQFTPNSISEDVIPDRLASLDEKVNSNPIADVKLKRKLDDSYDGHDDTGISATKTKVDEEQIVDANVGEGDIVGVQKI
ncbi:uncharacterized protein LOC143593069 [Bidens hawaiensis]|uniref:uncharacterized protein LOC143593069 n=1 Tax=Bidens hawaiensis TaxID=980011 RepID=UPI0040498006